MDPRDLFQFAADMARAERDGLSLTAIERHWLEADTEENRVLAMYHNLLTYEDAVRLWAYRIAP